MSTLELCEKFFGTRDVYKLLHLKKAASEKDVKKAYHKLSLLVHPDRVPEDQKGDATEKFKLLSKLYQVLTDTQKRALYDEQGLIADDDDGAGNETKLSSWLDQWSKLFQPINVEAINNVEKDYIDSEMERQDITNAYLGGKGCINYMMQYIPFMKVEDEPRIKKIVEGLIAAGDVPEYKIFTEEPAAKRKRRHQKYARESKEAEVIKRKKKKKDDQDHKDLAANGGNLEQMILERRTQRESNFNALIDRLMEKYVDKDDDKTASSLETKMIKKPKKTAKQTPKKSLGGVKTGRVDKAKH